MTQLSDSTLQTTRDRLLELKRGIAKVFVGKPDAVDSMTIALLARGHVLLEGVPGVAKTTLMKAFAATMGCSARRIQFTPDLLPADITGTYILSPKDGTFSLRSGPIFANVVLADELNRAPAKTQSALLEAMQERQVTIEGDRFELPSPFIVIATQNPIDLQGTYPLPEAQVDRFMLRVPMSYPSHEDEVLMLRTHGIETQEATPILSADEVRSFQALASRVFIDDDLLHYATMLTTFTRKLPQVLLGASPRATLALVQAAKACALMSGRAFVLPDDIRVLAVPVLAHRLVLDGDSEGATRARETVIEQAIAKVSYRPAMKRGAP